MNEEEKKAIEQLKSDVKYADLMDIVDDDCTVCYIEDVETVLNLITKQQKEIEDYKTIEKIEVDNENRLNEEEVLISTMKYYIETNQIMTVPEQENQLIAIKYILNEKNKQINNSISKDKIKEIHKNTDNKYSFTEQILKLIGE